MKDGFIKVAVCTPDLKVADCFYNAEQMIQKAEKMEKEGVRLLAFPELAITGYTCNDIFLQDTLLEGALNALQKYKEATAHLNLVSVIGIPLEYKGRLYNTAMVLNKGRILGAVPKSHIPNYSEFYEARQFSSGKDMSAELTLPTGDTIIVSPRLLFAQEHMPEFCFGMWRHALP